MGTLVVSASFEVIWVIVRMEGLMTIVFQYVADVDDAPFGTSERYLMKVAFAISQSWGDDVGVSMQWDRTSDDPHASQEPDPLLPKSIDQV